jgi:hypothetical protein
LKHITDFQSRYDTKSPSNCNHLKFLWTKPLRGSVVFAAMLLCQFSVCLATEAPDPNDSSKYLNAVQEFADNVLKYGISMLVWTSSVIRVSENTWTNEL